MVPYASNNGLELELQEAASSDGKEKGGDGMFAKFTKRWKHQVVKFTINVFGFHSETCLYHFMVSFVLYIFQGMGGRKI